MEWASLWPLLTDCLQTVLFNLFKAFHRLMVFFVFSSLQHLEKVSVLIRSTNRFYLASLKPYMKRRRHLQVKMNSESTLTENLVSLNDIIQEVDREIQNIYQQCLESGYSQAEICAFSSPVIHDLLNTADKKWKKWRKMCFYFIMIIGIILFISHLDWTPVFVSSFGRNVLITVSTFRKWFG